MGFTRKQKSRIEIIIFENQNKTIMDVQSTEYAIIEKVIQTSNEDVLSEVQAILEQEEEIILTDWQKEELDKRESRHNKAESKNFTWEEVKKRARSGL